MLFNRGFERDGGVEVRDDGRRAVYEVAQVLGVPESGSLLDVDAEWIELSFVVRNVIVKERKLELEDVAILDRWPLRHGHPLRSGPSRGGGDARRRPHDLEARPVVPHRRRLPGLGPWVFAQPSSTVIS